MAPPTLNHPPFPPLVWDDVTWAAEVVLPEWAGFQTRLGPYNAVSSPTPSDGRVRLRFTVDGSQPFAPLPCQAAAFDYLRKHGIAIREAILTSVFAEYPRFREEYLDAFDEHDDDFPQIAAAVPVLDHPNQLANLIGLGNVFVLTTAREGLSYIGFEFGCEWEEEHGLGVMTHQTRIIDIGQAPTAFLDHLANNDADTGPR